MLFAVIHQAVSVGSEWATMVGRVLNVVSGAGAPQVFLLEKCSAGTRYFRGLCAQRERNHIVITGAQKELCVRVYPPIFIYLHC